jgi:hypothetical protein
MEVELRQLRGQLVVERALTRPSTLQLEERIKALTAEVEGLQSTVSTLVEWTKQWPPLDGAVQPLMYDRVLQNLPPGALFDHSAYSSRRSSAPPEENPQPDRTTASVTAQRRDIQRV